MSKIDDFVNIWAKSINLEKDNVIKMIKYDIIRRCRMYGGIYPTISVEDDDCKAYIIKPTNGKYSLEDFLLNRLMLGIRGVYFSPDYMLADRSAAEYVSYYKSLNIDTNAMFNFLSSNGFSKEDISAILIKTIGHELGHCFKTSFTDGYKALPGSFYEGAASGWQNDIYKQLIDNLRSFENGKYADLVITKDELIEKYSEVKKTGIKDSEKTHYYAQLEFIDELFNEGEALDLYGAKKQGEQGLRDDEGNISSSGNYVDVYNFDCGYSTFTAYYPILKTLIGNNFYTEYISSVKAFETFDTEYKDIFMEEYKEIYDTDQLDELTPTVILQAEFLKLIKNRYNEKITLTLDKVLARCFEKKVDDLLERKNGILSGKSSDNILNMISVFKSKMTKNADEEKHNSLPHIVVFSRTESKVKNAKQQSDGNNAFQEEHHTEEVAHKTK